MSFTLRAAPHGSIAVIAPDALLPDHWEETNVVMMPLANPQSAPPDIGVSNVGAFPPKQIFGDFDRTSHQVLSSFVQQSWAGGGQKTDSQESSDTDRFAYLASLETRFPRNLTLLPLTRVIEGPNTDGARILGDLLVSGNQQTYVSFDLDVHRVSNLSSVAIDTLPSPAVNIGQPSRVSGATLLYIPMGSNGYCTFDGANVSAAITTVKPLNIVYHDKKLWSLDIDGNIHKSVDGTAWTLVAQLESEYLPRRLDVGRIASDAPNVYAITDRMVFAVDETNSTVYPTELNYAPHPYAGVASSYWRTDLYVAIGLGAQRYTLGTVNAVGLDRDDSVGASFGGYISAMARGFNDLFLGVSAAPSAGGDVEDIQPDVDPSMYISGSSAVCTVNRIGGAAVPATAWVAPSAGGAVVDLFVSTAQGRYRLYWTWKGRVYFQTLPTDFDNPALNPTQEFEQSGTLTGSWLDMGMSVDRMTMAAIELEVHHATDTETITIQYQIDQDDITETWHHLVNITEPGRYELRVGENGLLPDGQVRYDGIGFGRMRYRILMERDPEDAAKRPLMEVIIVSFLKRMRRVKSFDFEVDCTSKDYDAHWGLGNRQRAELLDLLIEQETWVPFTYNDKWHMVRFAYSNGRDRTGQDLRGNRSVSVLVPWEQQLGVA